jgi:hypothetical protein
MEPAGSLSLTNVLIAGSYPELHDSSLHLPIFKIIYYLHRIFPLQILQKILCVLPFSLFHVTCTAYLILFISLPQCLMKTTNYEASDYKIFPGDLIIVLSFAQFQFGSLPLI